ncbi:MAG TPA: hypothetical protein DEF51_54650 [Myxococcales bacterium]|nr:hypothetical protein [Myxococcales bacterium]
MRALSALLTSALLVACAPEPVAVDLGFPREENFLFTESGRLVVYETSADLGACPAIFERIEAGAFGDPVIDSDWRPICELRDGLRFAAPEGPHAYVALGRDGSNQIILSGCRVAEAFADAPAIEVELYPTDDYASSTAGRTPGCANAQDKCTRGCL